MAYNLFTKQESETPVVPEEQAVAPITSPTPRDEYIHDKEKPARSAASWVLRNFSKASEKEEKKRQSLRNIGALSDVLRHAANLYYTSKGATPQTIKDTVPQLEAKWKEEDEKAYDQAKEQANLDYKIAKAQEDADYRAKVLAGRDEDRQQRDSHHKENLEYRVGKDQQTAEWREKEAQRKKDEAEKNRQEREKDRQQRDRHHRESISVRREANDISRSKGHDKDDDDYKDTLRVGKETYRVTQSFKNNIIDLYDQMASKGYVNAQTEPVFGQGNKVVHKTKYPSQSEMILAVTQAAAKNPNAKKLFKAHGERHGFKLKE